jgi:acyl carrier protein
VDQRGVEDVLIELLAEGQCKTAEQLRVELLAAGEDLPIDSFLTTEVVAAVQSRYGIRMPAEGSDRYLKSVRAFAAQVCAQVARVEDEEVRGA